ncbi:MAG: tetraacyldisaccharide 4'-kinase [Methylococcales symbiont of Iophon sp. n. MRB-2018]|nr:MAG: tetraacyldisaccharide 4'-kinase [Methylococcales symbiont of Iophon sp. n. MRB-2018]KAF3979320.1 MAG: tetraacyldisaccharide 4'-kinase [Methylococcales symbiont of Iophon sp. n. MRB-2018]
MKKSFSRWLQDEWYREMYISAFFMPISMLYADFIRFRSFLYNIGIRKKHKIAVPVIVVGNITLGGTGKTPLILWLARFLREEGYKPGIISRGYGGESAIWPQWVDEQSKADQVGDEAVLIKQQADCPVVVGPKRVKAAQLLLDKSDCNIILSDDGLQHYALKRDIEIAVIDGERRFGNGYMLPCGPLREPIERLQKVDLVIVNGIAEEENEFAMAVEGDLAVNLVNKEEKLLDEFKKQNCHALAGIGNPKRFFNLLEKEGLLLECHAFPDHHQFIAEDISFEDDKPVLMTAKDAVKCMDFATDKHWYVPIKVQPEQLFIDKLLKLIKEKIRG